MNHNTRRLPAKFDEFKKSINKHGHNILKPDSYMY